MKPFVFRLESVRALREQTQQQAQQELAHDLALREQRERELTSAARRVQQALVTATPEQGVALDGTQLAARQAWVERVERERHSADAGLRAQEDEVAAGRMRLESASRDREVLERLRKRRLAAHRQEVARHEEAVMGEVALTAHRRRGNEAAA
jgi:flagellar FliJ protein